MVFTRKTKDRWDVEWCWVLFLGGFLFGLAINLKRLAAFITKEPLSQLASATMISNWWLCLRYWSFNRHPVLFYEETINVSKDIFQITGSIIDSTYKMLAPFYLIIVRGFHSTHLPLQSVGVSCLVRDSFFFTREAEDNSSPGSPLQNDAWKTKLLPLLHGSVLQKEWTLVNLGGKTGKLSSSGGISACEKVI